jgi:hypothetical protein
MKHRKLRIAWSVAWGITAVLLIALWVRSYWWADVLLVPLTDRHAIAAGSISGGISFCPCVSTTDRIDSSQMLRSDKYGELPPGLMNSHLSREKLALIAQHEGMWANLKNHPRTIRFGIRRHTFISQYVVLVGCACVFAVLAWIRFRLRTLLIATTLVAAVLGYSCFKSNHGVS